MSVDHYLRDIMDARTKNSGRPIQRMNPNPSPLVEGTKVDYRKSYLQRQNKRIWRVSYFSLESLLLLICLTASLLILPLILPPLPPPPFMLLLLPIGILTVLMVLAFMPSNVRDLTNTYM